MKIDEMAESKNEAIVKQKRSSWPIPLTNFHRPESKRARVHAYTPMTNGEKAQQEHLYAQTKNNQDIQNLWRTCCNNITK